MVDLLFQTNHNLKKIISIISKPSNFILKITIIEGWDKKN